ncbi:putative structural maintenance of chromosomes protein fused with sulphatase-modifying factor [Vibrio fluvialis]|uniref:Structural maintenance of chromosomes protein fused with sulphatase-modifying factor n=2 Tax=Vibrio fluvialis TaxID=676 RepID=A0AAX2LV05_VIBFL|nr:SUMF1/EgtB/PvdO family nonheme iron enzyme [Vibrio fluvialis]MBY8229607.1 SUMF1/EgtB/PvdO family nonheme iron enzyme [Vibrio fluvialis]MCE7633348.1 SUMF1/EgtB/PvdO family nonheme iron enzyme [Vibrio fluvialis]SUQ26699.1 putative structural maintenance of chromosomes protein fused with sulphatase-modifying factor [Vibrio fluvialis]
MRQGLPALLFALSPCLLAVPAIAEDTAPATVMAIDDALFSKQSELQDAKKATQTQQTAVDNQQAELDRLNKQTQSLDAALKTAKANLERDYQKMIDEPELDITGSQNAYQAAWSDIKQNQKARLEAEQKLQEQQAALAQTKSAQQVIEQSIVKLDQDKLRARVERLRSELNRTGEQKVSFTNACSADMTLAQCAKQTTDLALQKAVKQFQAWLIDETSEAAVVKQHLADVSLNIHVLKHTTTDSGFYDGSKFKTVIDTQLDARPAENTPCKLLNVDSQYCFAPGENAQTSKQKEVAWVNLAIRSNQYNDKVSVDGVSYGSTPVEIMLPVGNHMITVEKEGYRSFHQELSINSDHTLRAVLREQANILKQGFKFADSLKGNIKAPEMITLVSGEYLLGENASRQVLLDHAFAVSATPITVGEFETFVNQTGYQTDAELQNVCIAVNNSEVTPIPDSYWRNPGFKQSAQSPAVCISQNDANAYTHWLSKQTGFTYRLPSEDEWEVAARSGSKTSYWWGDNFGSGQANTGWGGTPWSNKSTSPVRSFEPNRLGFYDVVGNVWQWTNDARGLAKGGAWSFSPEMAKAESELFISPSAAANYVGFRILREL